MPLLNLFGGAGGLQLNQTAQSDSGSGFTGGAVTIEGLKVGGASDNTMILLAVAVAALVIAFLVFRK